MRKPSSPAISIRSAVSERIRASSLLSTYIVYLHRLSPALAVHVILRWKTMARDANGPPVRLKDIAEELNVSVMTVSKVVRGQTDVSEATRKRVLERVRAL